MYTSKLSKTQKQVNDLREQRTKLLEKLSGLNFELAPYEPIILESSEVTFTVEQINSGDYVGLTINIKVPYKNLRETADLGNITAYTGARLTIEPLLQKG